MTRQRRGRRRLVDRRLAAAIVVLTVLLAACAQPAPTSTPAATPTQAPSPTATAAPTPSPTPTPSTLTPTTLTPTPATVPAASPAASCGPSCVRGPATFVTHGPRDSRSVALTFDDGFNIPACISIIDTLLARDAAATFFPNGIAATRRVSSSCRDGRAQLLAGPRAAPASSRDHGASPRGRRLWRFAGGSACSARGGDEHDGPDGPGPR